jgi:hypothetical protein
MSKFQATNPVSLGLRHDLLFLCRLIPTQHVSDGYSLFGSNIYAMIIAYLLMLSNAIHKYVFLHARVVPRTWVAPCGRSRQLAQRARLSRERNG